MKDEALSVFNTFVLPNWHDPKCHYDQTLYGYVLRVYSCVDLLSSFWRGTESDQSPRMVDFLETFTPYPRDVHSVAVQIWRHKLVHIARPRALHEPQSGLRLYWLLQWYEPHLPRSMHMTFSVAHPLKVLNTGAIYLIEDAITAGKAYEDQLTQNPDLQFRAETFAKTLAEYPLRHI